VVAAEWSDSLSIAYTRKVNLNRVHISSALVINPEGEKHCTLAAEYTLKQSKLNMSIDSNLTVASTVETTVAQGVQMQFSADVSALQNQYKFGYGIVMG